MINKEVVCQRCCKKGSSLDFELEFGEWYCQKCFEQYVLDEQQKQTDCMYEAHKKMED